MPPVELDEPPEDEPELLAELDALVLDEEELEPLVLPEEPKLDDPPVAPELVEVEAPELVEVEAPELVEVEAPELVEVDAPELVDDVLVDAPELVELVEAPLELELELPWLEEPWPEEPWLDDPWPLLEEPRLDDPLDPFWFWFWFSF